jgi:hypothetical protein
MPPTTADQVRTVCAELTKEPMAALVTNPNWGALNFTKAQPDLEQAAAIATTIKNLPIETLPPNELVVLRDRLNPVLALVDRMRKFTIEAPNAVAQRDEIIAQIKGEVPQLYAQAQIRVPFLALQRGDVRRNEEAFAQALANMQQLVANATKTAADRQREIDQIISAMREASATVGVAHFTTDFLTTADKCDTQSRQWLFATAGFAAATIVAALAFPFVFTTNTTIDMHGAQILTSKLVTLGVLFTTTIWCGRMYKAGKHQAAVNRHRGDALKTFQAFVKATNDESTRDAVLLETTRSIFALTSTGYLDGSDGTNDAPIKILEVIKSAANVAAK